MDKGIRTTTELGFDDAVAATREALAGQGFGVVSEIDIAATLKKKIDVDIEPQLILGACNPNFAHQALQADASVGLLLPCNVVVRRESGSTVIEAVDPTTMMPPGSGLEDMAAGVKERLQAALDTIG